MSTLQQLRTRVRAYLDEPVAAYWADAELNTWINQAYFYYYMWIVASFEGYFAKDILIDIVATQPKYAIPNDFYKIRLLERVYNSWTVPLRVYDRMETANITANSNYSQLYLPTYRFEGQNIVLEPTPDTDITGGLRLEYVPQPTALTVDASTPDAGYLTMWEEPLVIRAAISAKMKEESVVNSGTDVGTLQSLMTNYEQTIKESFEQRTMQRRYTEPFGPEDGGAYYP